MKLYISSKMTGVAANNREAFNDMEEILKGLGHDVVNPVYLGEELNSYRDSSDLEEPTYSDYLLNDLYALSYCDGIVMFGKWIGSNGAQAEYHFALAIGIQVYYWDRYSEKLRKFTEVHHE